MPKKVIRTLYKARHVSIDCKLNDIEDVKKGGPIMRGFDFYIDCDEKPTEVKAFLEEVLKRVGLPCKEIRISRPTYELAKAKVWSLKRVEKCIRREAPSV